MIKVSDTITDLSRQTLLGKTGFIPPQTEDDRKIMSAGAKHCEENNLLDRRSKLKTNLSLRQDGQPVYLYRFISAPELSSLLQKGFYHASSTPTSESSDSFLNQIERAIYCLRKISLDAYPPTTDDYFKFFNQAGIKRPAEIIRSIAENDIVSLRELIHSEFSAYERACIQKAPYLSGLNGFFSTSVIPSNSDYLISGYYCFLELAVPATRMMPPGLKDYLISENKYSDGEAEIGLEYYTLDEVTKFFFWRDDMLTDSEMFERLKIPEAPGIRSRPCPFEDWRFKCNFLDYLPAEILASPQKWIENLS